MSRKSLAEMAVAPAVELDRRLQAPEGLTVEHTAIWHAITATKPADWFQADCAALLESYVRHIVSARVIDEKIDQMERDGFEDADKFLLYEKLLNMRDKQTKLIQTTGTKLRLTPQSRYDRQAAAVSNKRQAKKLWDQ